MASISTAKFYLIILSYFYMQIAVMIYNNSSLHVDARGSGSGFSSYFIALDGDYSCTIDEWVQLNTENQNVIKLAKEASAALSVTNSQKSPSYQKWFGASNKKYKERVKTNHYDSVVKYLKAPNAGIDWYQYPVASSNGRFTNFKVEPQSLVFICGTTNRPPCNMPNIIASTDPSNPYRATVVFLCPRIFTSQSFDAMKTQWIDNNGEKLDESMSETLLHEMQHTTGITGDRDVTIDVDRNAQKYPRGYCYSPLGCPKLSNSEKIKNAQNFVFYALDAAFRPDTILPPPESRPRNRDLYAGAFSSLSTRTASKISESILSLLEIFSSSWPRSMLMMHDSSAARFKPTLSSTHLGILSSLSTKHQSTQLISSSSLSSSKAISITGICLLSHFSTLTPPFTWSLSSTSPHYCTSSYTSSSSLTTSSNSSSSTTTTPLKPPVVVTITISSSQTTNVAPGVVVIGGVEGGYFIDEGKAYHTSAGETATADDDDQTTSESTSSTSSSSSCSSRCISTTKSTSTLPPYTYTPKLTDINLATLNEEEFSSYLSITAYIIIKSSTTITVPDSYTVTITQSSTTTSTTTQSSVIRTTITQ